MKQEHHPKDIRTNSQGAAYDIEKEFSGNENKGTYFDSENGRVSSNRGNKGAWEKIRGEEVIHDKTFVGDWFCMCSIDVNDDIFELWVEKLGLDDPYIVINSIVMGKSPDMPWEYAHRIQFDKNESCIGGEIYLTDFNVPPIIFSIKDIKDAFAAGDLAYFDNFNLNLYSINLATPLDIPVFTGLANLSGGGGLPVGSYQYSLRYVNDDGDATNWGPLTPSIPVVQSLSSASNQYPSIKTYGSVADLANPTSYGIQLQFRVTNINDYDFIEIRRISYNVSAGIDFVPQGTIVAKLNISPGEISIRDFVDPKDSNIDEETLADNEEAGQLAAIEKAKAIRYYDKRLVLMNIESPSKDAEIDFLEYNGKKILPIVENLGKRGHNNPVAHTYVKNYPSNEKYSFAVNLYDGLGGSGFTIEDDALKNVQAPSRRDRMSSDSQDLSAGGSSVAAAVDSVVDNTFEVFSHENAISKNDSSSFKNILEQGNKLDSTVNEYDADAGFGSLVTGLEIGYLPYKPTDDNDSVIGHDYIVNQEVKDSSTKYSYRPKGFGCDYYSRGFALGGVDNLPPWAKSFSIVRSERAGRVVCQGIGMYSLNKGNFAGDNDFAGATKEKNKLWFTSPDIEGGLINQSILDDMDANPQNYSIQFCSPLGFFSEVYSFEKNSLFEKQDRLVDMVTYARILRDDGQINPNEDASMGVNGYVAYNKYRNNNTAGQGAFNAVEGGNKIFPMKGFNFKFDGRENYYEIEILENIYNANEVLGAGAHDFDDQVMKDFTEPFYIINILQEGKEVRDLNINSYYPTGHYQKIDSIIGEGSDGLNQSFVLVDERWEDPIPSLTPTGFNNGGESFVYLVDEQQNERVCFNVTYKTPTEILVIMTDISANGFYLTPGGVQVHGIYTHSQDANANIFLNFDNSITTPASNERVIVRYDNSRPLRFFGGDTVIGENIFSPIDKESDGTTSDEDQQFDFNIGFPFRQYIMNPRHYVVRKTTGVNKIQNDNSLHLGFIRQMCVMYACESRLSSSLSHNGGFPLEHFPLTHYVMRPNRWDESSFESGVIDDITNDNNLLEGYLEDYPEEYTLWKFGGFRFEQQFNIDYSVAGPILYFSKPKVGFEEENKFCTGIAWSLPRSVNQQNSPGLKSFPGGNRFIISDDQGEIKKAYDATSSGKGENLYSIGESGICLLLTKKSILSSLTAEDLSVTANDKFISREYWLSKEIGSDGEMWRGMAEGSVDFSTDGGKNERESLFIPNRHSVYRLTDNVISDIVKDKYYTRIHPSLQGIANDYSTHITGHYDKSHNEYWMQMPDVDQLELQKSFAFAQDTGHWIGRFDYDFDFYLYEDSRTIGLREGKSYELDKGFLIKDLPIIAELIQHTSIELSKEKEFITIEINTGPRGKMKPTEIVFMDEEMTELCRVNEALFGPGYLRQYDGWWNQIPRKEVAASPSRDRVQYRLILFKIIHDQEEDFKVVSSVIQYKEIK